MVQSTVLIIIRDGDEFSFNFSRLSVTSFVLANTENV